MEEIGRGLAVHPGDEWAEKGRVGGERLPRPMGQSCVRWQEQALRRTWLPARWARRGAGGPGLETDRG